MSLEAYEENEYIPETIRGSELRWDGLEKQAAYCSECSSFLKYMGPSEVDDNEAELLFSCRNRVCGGDSVAGAGSVKIRLSLEQDPEAQYGRRVTGMDVKRTKNAVIIGVDNAVVEEKEIEVDGEQMTLPFYAGN